MARINSKEEALKDRLGSDLKFPIQGSFVAISGLEVLLQDIQILLLTLPGERPGRPEFGCALRNQIWENFEQARTAGSASIREALERFEPRISLLNVNSTANENTGLITFNIQFIVNSTDTSANLIFPFRVGTQLSFS